MEVTEETTWKRSKRSSGGANNCVELATIGVGAVRDSKNPNGPMLTVDLAQLLTVAKRGQLDR